MPEWVREAWIATSSLALLPSPPFQKGYKWRRVRKGVWWHIHPFSVLSPASENSAARIPEGIRADQKSFPKATGFFNMWNKTLLTFWIFFNINTRVYLGNRIILKKNQKMPRKQEKSPSNSGRVPGYPGSENFPRLTATAPSWCTQQPSSSPSSSPFPPSVIALAGDKIHRLGLAAECSAWFPCSTN